MFSFLRYTRTASICSRVYFIKYPSFCSNAPSTFSGEIPLDKLQITHTKSSKPGGQNVNKVNSKVEIRFHVSSAEWIPKDIRENLLLRETSRINKDGFLMVSSDRTRHLLLNQADCLDRLRVIIRSAVKVPPPEPTEEELKLREARKSKAESVRISDKKIKSQVKSERGSL